MMLRKVIIFILGIVVIPTVQTEISGSRGFLDRAGQANDQGEAVSIEEANRDVGAAFDEFLPVVRVDELTTEKTLLTTQVIVAESTDTTTTTKAPILPFFQCYFDDACFAKDQLVLTNGSEFNRQTYPNHRVPRHPMSHPSVMSVTTINQICELPFRPELDNGPNRTEWDMWFCYKNECPTASALFSTCTSGNYGFVSLTADETNRTVSDTLYSPAKTREERGEQCLRFYYYFTVYEKQDWGQQIEVLISPDSGMEQPISIGQLSVQDMDKNKWYSREMTFSPTSRNYTLTFHFAVTISNRTDDVATNKTVYFALDNLEVYDYNCSYVSGITTVTSPTSTTEEQATAPPKPSSRNLGLILGLVLGLGLPVLLLAIGGAVFYVKKHKTSGYRMNDPVAMQNLRDRPPRRSEVMDTTF